MSRAAKALLSALFWAAALPAWAAAPPAAAPDPWRDPVGYTAHLLAATCGLEDPGAAALGRTLGDAALVADKSLKRGGRETGWRRRYRLTNGDEILVMRAAPGGLLRRFAVEFYQRRDGGAAQPVATVLSGSDCKAFHGRRIRYDIEGRALELELLGPDLAGIGAREPLNPPVPGGPDLGDQDPGGVAVALFDSGLNYILPAFAQRLARDAEGKALGYDFWDLDDRPFDSHPTVSPFFPLRHGTEVASLLIHEAPAARLLPYRYPRPELARMADMVEAAAAAGALIVTLPMSSRNPDDWRAFAAAAAAHPEMLFVVAAGNEGHNIDEQPAYPAAFDLENLLVVTSSDAEGRLPQDSNWGPLGVDLMVPGENLQVIDFTGTPRRRSGSSYAVPRVAALAARLLSARPGWQGPELKAAILARAEPPPGPAASQVRHGWLPDPAAGP